MHWILGVLGIYAVIALGVFAVEYRKMCDEEPPKRHRHDSVYKMVSWVVAIFRSVFWLFIFVCWLFSDSEGGVR